MRSVTASRALEGATWRRHVPHVVMAVAMVTMHLVPIAPLSPPVWFVTLGGVAIWLARTEEVAPVRHHGVYDLAGMAVVMLALPMPGMPGMSGGSGAAPASGAALVLLGCWLAGKLLLEVRHPLRDPWNAAMVAVMGLMIA
ncbi:hypothetical protein [Amycolatopsis jejuensis]|uniref:hypothetical protein n=1 Tax=Amycolatopsis jejuensis TaxID=330084 RepID=UPI0005256E8F|nr:hypothetical protein [Amycolatopsis jejuensis]